MTESDLRSAVLVTGVAGAIGRATALAFHSKGYTVFGWDRDDPGTAPEIVFTQCDVLDEAAVEDALGTVQDSSTNLRHVVCVAGGGDLEELSNQDVAAETLETFQRVVANNLFTAFMTTRSAVTELRATEGDKSITFVSSVNSLGGFGAPGYSAAKAGLSGLAKSLAPSLGRDGIRVNALLLGTVETPNFMGLLRSRGLDDTRLEDVAERAALRRVLQSTDVAQAALRLALDFTGMTGADVVLDNGQILAR